MFPVFQRCIGAGTVRVEDVVRGFDFDGFAELLSIPQSAPDHMLLSLEDLHCFVEAFLCECFVTFCFECVRHDRGSG